MRTKDTAMLLDRELGPAKDMMMAGMCAHDTHNDIHKR